MAKRTRANFKSTKNGSITTNGTGAITGAVMNAILEDIADSFVMFEDLLTDWDMDSNLFPAGSVKGQRYYGIITTSSTLLDVNGDPLPSKIFATALQDGASTTDPAEWAFTYTIN